MGYLFNSIASTEDEHNLLISILPPSIYFRFNPFLTEYPALDEIRSDKLSCIRRDARIYIRRNSGKLERAVSQLLKPRPSRLVMRDRIFNEFSKAWARWE